jgi:uncharacterized OB-fold protein
MSASFVRGYEPPYVVAEVALDEQPSLVLTSNILDASVEDVTVDAPVRVVFEQRGDMTLPQFVMVSSGDEV